MASVKARIRFEGKTLECRTETTVAVALWENGIRHLSRSPKYGRPRGVTCARGHCTACLMRVDGIPNVRVCELAVRDGMDIRRQDGGAFYAVPMQKVLAMGDAFFPVGFYYKWFTRPPFVSRLFLEGIRPMTGIGRLPSSAYSLRALPPDPASNEQTDLGTYDTIVVGAGPSGLQAATEAAGRTLLIDDHPEPGGQRRAALEFLTTTPNDLLDHFPFLGTARDRINGIRDRLTAKGELTFRGGTRAIAGYYPGGVLLRSEGALMTVRSSSVVWAAGALDTLGLFQGNDVPGVLGPRAMFRLVLRDGLDLRGKRALVIGSGLDFWLSAAVLSACGVQLGLVVTDEDGLEGIPAAVGLGWQLNTGLRLDRIERRRDIGLQAVFSPHGPHDSVGETHLEMEADLAVICRRGKPTYDVPYQLGADLTLQPDRGGFVVTGSPGDTRIDVTGEAAGHPPDHFLQRLKQGGRP